MKSPQYKVIAWGQKGQKSGTRIISKKPYAQQGSARKYAQQMSAKKSRSFVVHYVDLMLGDDVVERFKKGEIVTGKFASPDAKTKDSTPTSSKKRKPNVSAGLAVTDAISKAGKYEHEMRRHAAGEIKYPPAAKKYGLSKSAAKKIRDRVRDEATAPPLHPVDAATKRAKQKRRQQPTAAKRTAARETISTLQIDVATAEAAMQALLRERQAAVKAAQSDLENTLAQCSQMGVHASIA